MVFVSPIDINKFQKVKAEFQRQLNSADSKDKRAIFSRYYGDNFIRKPEADVVIINPITNKPVVIEEGINTLIERKKLQFEKGVISENELESYISDTAGYVENGVTKYKAEFLTINPVKFKNPAYDAITGSKKKYYDFLVSSYFKSQARLPHKMGYVLPSIHKSGFDAVRQGGLVKYLKYEWSQLKDFKAEDINKYGEEGKNIPLIFNFDMDAQDVSLDLIQSIVMYEAESLEYQAKARMADTGEVLLSLVEKATPYETDTLGNKKLDAFAEKAGIKDEFLKYKKLFKGNNVASLLAFYIDSQIYGKMNIKTVGSDTKVLGMNLEKLVDGITGFASMTQVGGNPIGSVVNYLQAAMQAVIEAAAKKHMSMQSWLKSRVVYDSHIMDYIGDFNSPYSKSLIGQIIDLYDPMQGEYKDSAGRRISKSMFKKMWSTNSWFFLQHQGEHSIQIRTMIAMMLDTKAINKDGKYINLYDAYTKGDDGKIKLKEGVKLQGKLSENGLISREFQSTLHAVNKELQGVYNKQDKPMIESYWWGRLIVMYKKFLAPGLKRRYKALGYNQEMGDVTEGYLRTFYKKLMVDVGELSKFMVGIDNGYFETHEKENLRRARREMLIVATTGLVVILLSALLDNTDDDDEKLRIKFLLYMALRINSDLGIYGTPGDPTNLGMPSPSEMFKTFKNPIAAYSILNRLQKLVNQMLHPTEVYEVKSGFWDKGDSKLWAAWLKFWGINGVNFDPSNSIKIIQMTSK
jgi:Ca2+-binding EF-hand superfamily protein